MSLHSTGRRSNQYKRPLLTIPILIMLLVSGLSCVSKGTYEKLATERTSIQSELTSTKADLSSTTTERDKLNSELTATKAGLSSITAQRDSLNGQLTSTNASLSSMTAERDKLSSQLTSTNVSLSSMTAQRDSLNGQLTATNASLSSMTADRDKLDTELTATKASLSSITAQRDSLNSQLTSTNASLSSMTADRDKLTSQLATANANLSSMTADRDKLSSQLTSTNASLSSMTADRDKLSGQLAAANASLSSMTAERDKLSSQLTSTNASLSAVTAQRDSLSSQLTAAKASLSSMTAERDGLNSQVAQLSARVTQLQGDYQKLFGTIKQSTLNNPTWPDLKGFLEQDDTNRLVYKAAEFDCSGFAITLRDRAWRYGFRCAYIEIVFVDTGHALTAFQTTDKGLVYIDATGNTKGTGFDRIGYVQVGQPYGTISLDGVKSQYIDASGDPAKFWGALTYTTHPNPFSYDYYVNYRGRVQFYMDSRTAYNLAVAQYNAGSRIYSSSQLSAWKANLNALQIDLASFYYGLMEAVQTIEIYWN